MLVAILVGDDEMGHPFWIAKITNIIKDELSNQVMSIVVHWYHTSSLEGGRGRGRGRGGGRGANNGWAGLKGVLPDMNGNLLPQLTVGRHATHEVESAWPTQRNVSEAIIVAEDGVSTITSLVLSPSHHHHVVIRPVVVKIYHHHHHHHPAAPTRNQAKEKTNKQIKP